MSYGGASLFGNASIPSPPVLEVQGSGEYMEAGDCPLQSSAGPTRDWDTESSSSGTKGPSSKKARQEKPLSKEELIIKSIEDFYKDHPCIPAEALCNTQQYLAERNLRYMRGNDHHYIKAMDCINLTHRPKEIRDFKTWYDTPGCCPIFAAPDGINSHSTKVWLDELGQEIHDWDHKPIDPNTAPYKYMKQPYYMDRVGTLKVISRLLDHQHGAGAKAFLQTVVNVVDKRVPKKNTLLLVSPPSAGKTYFMDFVANFFLFVGRLGNFRKTEGFPLMDCVSKRILVWNEPNTTSEDATRDTIKMVFAGDSCPAAIKFKGPGVITRTPVFVMTNNSTIFRTTDPDWEDRIYRYEWDKAPFLFFVYSYPNPRYFPDLLDMYDIEY